VVTAKKLSKAIDLVQDFAQKDVELLLAQKKALSVKPKLARNCMLLLRQSVGGARSHELMTMALQHLWLTIRFVLLKPDEQGIESRL
jgi:hypothetical protein